MIVGRRRKIINLRCPKEYLRAEAEKEAINSVVQMTAADIGKLNGLVRLDRELKKRKLPGDIVLHVYDSVDVEVPDEAVDDVARDRLAGLLVLSQARLHLVGNQGLDLNHVADFGRLGNLDAWFARHFFILQTCRQPPQPPMVTLTVRLPI